MPFIQKETQNTRSPGGPQGDDILGMGTHKFLQDEEILSTILKSKPRKKSDDGKLEVNGTILRINEVRKLLCDQHMKLHP